jgi:predicted DNA-binding transcriptional regulator AlpA
MEHTQASNTRQGSRKKAPREDLYSAAEAIQKTGLPKSTFQRFVREGKIPKETPFGKREGYYPRTFIDTLAAHLEGTTSKKVVSPLLDQLVQKEPQQRGETDWIQMGDLPYVLALDYEMYGMDEVVDIRTTSTWWAKNAYQCRILFDKSDRTKIWGVLTLMPLPLDVIHHLLRRELLERDITSEDILVYEPGKSYDVYVASAIIRPEHRGHLRLLIQSVLSFWCDQYPSIRLRRLYAYASSDQGMDLIKHLFFSPLYDLAENAFVLDPYQRNPSPLVRTFQTCIKQKELGTTLEQARTGARFALAQEKDMQGIYNLAARLFPRTIDAQRRRNWFEKNPEGQYVVRRNGNVLAYFYLQALKHDRLLAYMNGEIRGWDITADDIETFEPGKPVECLIGGIGSDPDVGDVLRSAYVAILLRGVEKDLERLGCKGIYITKVYAYSSTAEGIAMCTRLGMQIFAPPQGKRQTFILNVETSDASLVRSYKRGFAAWQKQQQ